MEKYYSDELRNLFEFINTIVMDEYHVTEIDIPVFIFGAIELKDSLLYNTISSYLSITSINKIEEEIYEIIDHSIISALRPTRKLETSNTLKSIIVKAKEESQLTNSEYITSDHILLAVLHDNEQNQIKDIFNRHGLNYQILLSAATKMHEITNKISTSNINPMPNVQIKVIGGGEINGSLLEDITKSLANDGRQINIDRGNTNLGKEVSCCINLNKLAESGKIDDLIGREKEIKLITKIFNRRKCNNVLLIGDSGVGKTQIVYGLAKLIVDKKAPTPLLNKTILSLNIGDMLSGTQFRGMLENKISNLIKELNSKSTNILFIDDIHNVIGDKQKADVDFASLLNPLFEESKVLIITTTTPKGYRAAFNSNQALDRKFQKIYVDSPSDEENYNIINQLKPIYEKYHGIEYTDDAINACINLSKRYLTDRSLPSSAIDIMDEAGADKKIEKAKFSEVKVKKDLLKNYKQQRDEILANGETDKLFDIEDKIAKTEEEISSLNEPANYIVDVEDIYKTISEKTNIPIGKLNVSERKELTNINEKLKKYIIGQDDAIDKICRAIKRNKVGLSNPNKPIFSCFAVGSSGVGKTALAKKLAEEIYGDSKYLVRFDMSEYSDKTAVNKLIGSSAGYIGYEQGGLLTEAIKNKKHAVLLIDEIEKANEEIYNLFLQILDEGYLNDNTGTKVDFRNTIIILTSNIGTKEASLNKGLGFNVNENTNTQSIIEKEMKKKFPPEFINRIDDIVYFNNLSEDNLKQIIVLELNNLNDKLVKNGFSLQWNDDVVNYLFNIVSKQKEYGARPILRTIQKEIENRITDLIIDNDYDKYDFTSSIEESSLTIR